MSAEIESTEARTQKLEGLGAKRKRVEDVRFTQGKGNYVNDLKFPGMVFGAFVRSPYGHARVKSINTEAALKRPRASRYFFLGTGQLASRAPAWLGTESSNSVRSAGEPVIRRADVATTAASLPPTAGTGLSGGCGGLALRAWGNGEVVITLTS